MQFELKEFNLLRKSAKKALPDNAKRVRLAILANFSSQLLTQAIKGYGAEDHVVYETYEADYNQIEQEVFDETSQLYAFKPQFVLILKSTEHLVQNFYKTSTSERAGFAVGESDHISTLYHTIKSRLQCRVVFNNFIEVNDGVFGNFAVKTTLSLPYQLKKLNLLLMELAQQQPDLCLLDLQSLVSREGYKHTLDNKMYYSADMAYSIDFLPHIAREISNMVQSAAGAFKKCAILDLDNTLWGGVIGDDGIEGIQIGELGIGKIYSDLQLWLKQLKLRGIILAVCSKNTEQIAKEPFIKHPGMVLRLEDIALFVANWETKVDNINYIQQTLNIGFDSMVFIDDNPFEREHIKFSLPDITVPSLPDDPADYLTYLKSLNLFETPSFTTQDENRTKQYQQSAIRAAEQAAFHNADEYLASLQMVAEVGYLDSFTIPRIAQLSQRSNQFNLRTIRYTEEELKEIVAAGSHMVLTFTLKDKYGDNGLIAFVILKRVSDTALFIENWAMSCRVLKRGMEQFTLLSIASEAEKQGFKRIYAEYIPTAKNAIVKDHYINLGFTANGQNKFYLDLPVEKHIFNQPYIHQA